MYRGGEFHFQVKTYMLGKVVRRCRIGSDAVDTGVQPDEVKLFIHQTLSSILWMDDISLVVGHIQQFYI